MTPLVHYGGCLLLLLNAFDLLGQVLFADQILLRVGDQIAARVGFDQLVGQVVAKRLLHCVHFAPFHD